MTPTRKNTLISRYSLIVLFGLFYSLIISVSAHAQLGDDVLLDPVKRQFAESRGKDFWVCFPQNAKSGENSSSLTFKLYITADKATRGTVTIPGMGVTKNFSLNASEVINVEIDSIAQVFGSDVLQKLGVHVTAENPVAVFGLSSRKASTDTYLAYPTAVLGTAYRAMGYYPLGGGADNTFSTQQTFVATENNTNVTITLTGDTKGGRRAGETFTVAMQQGDVYQVQSTTTPGKKNDLTGSLFTSNKPIAFFAGHTCAQIPMEVNFCDQLLEMEPPITSWGRQFYIGRFESKQEYAIRALASEPNTQVFMNNQLVAKLDKAGDFYENNHVRDNAYLTTNKPILLAQYAQSSDADTLKVGDPFMLFITPTEQFLPYYRFLTPIKGDWHHYINLCVPTDVISTLKLDGQGGFAKYFKPIGISRFAIAQIEIGFGSHTVSCNKPFGLYSYGFGVAGDNYDSYGNNGGQLVATIPDVLDTIPPSVELVSENADLPLALIARDDRLFDVGLKSITVIDSANFRSPVTIPPFDPGTPQLPLLFRVRDTGTCGFMHLRLVDNANNESFFTICRTKVGVEWTYQLLYGKNQLCPSCRSWTVQFVATPSTTISNVTFQKPDYLKATGEYNSFKPQLSGGFYGSFIFPFSKAFQLSGGVGFSNFSGTALAHHTTFVPDSIFYGDTAGARYSKLIEEYAIDASFSYITLNGGIYHYFIPEKLYLYAGLSLGILVSSTYVQTSEILYPATIDYNTGDPQRKSTGARKIELAQGSFPQPTHFLVALELAPGFQFKLNKNFSLLTGLSLNMPLFDALKDVNWHLTSFGLRLGLQYRN